MAYAYKNIHHVLQLYYFLDAFLPPCYHRAVVGISQIVLFAVNPTSLLQNYTTIAYRPYPCRLDHAPYYLVEFSWSLMRWLKSVCLDSFYRDK